MNTTKPYPPPRSPAGNVAAIVVEAAFELRRRQRPGAIWRKSAIAGAGWMMQVGAELNTERHVAASIQLAPAVNGVSGAHQRVDLMLFSPAVPARS